MTDGAVSVTRPHALDPRSYRKMAVGVIIATILFLLPTPDGLSREGHNALALFFLLVYFWATEALPLPVSALGAGVGLVALGIVDRPNDAWTPYAQDTIFFLLGSLILADAVSKTDTDRVLAARLLRRLGTSTDMLLLGIIVVSTLSAMIISSHAVAAIMLPLVVSILRATKLYERRNIAAALVLAIAFGTGIAGLATPSAGSRNAIVIGYLDELYDIRISYLDWVLHATPITLLMIPVLYAILKFTFKVPHERIDPNKLPLDGGRLDPYQRRTLLVIGATVILWIWQGSNLGLGTVAIMGAIALFVLGILDWLDTRRRIAWGVPLIYGAALSMGSALQTTGAVQWLANAVLAYDIWDHQTTLVLAVLVLTAFLTNIMSDGGTAAVMAPIVLSLAAIQGFDIGRFGLLTAIASAYSFILVIGTPPNVITYSSGLFTARDLAKAGLPLTLAALLVTWLAVTFYWPIL